MEFYRAYYRPMFKAAMAAGATEEEAEDVVQDAMIDIHKHWESITSPRAYAATAIRHSIIKAQQNDRLLVSRMIERGHHEPVGKEDSGLVLQG